MLHTTGTVPRAEGSAGVRVESAPDRGMRLPVPEPLAPPPLRSSSPVVVAETALARVSLDGKPARRRPGWGVGAAIAGLCLIAIAVGSLVKLATNNDDKGATPSVAVSTSVESATESSIGDSSTIESSTVPETIAPTTIPPPANALPAPLVAYTAVCPVPGAGWEMVPTWPGDIEGLAEYDVEMLITDSWVSLTGWKAAADETSATLHRALRPTRRG